MVSMVPERRFSDLHAISEQEAALELARRDTAVQELALAFVLLLAAHEQLIVFCDDLELGFLEPGHRDGDEEPFGAVGIHGSLDIVGRVAVRGLRESVDPFFKGFKAQ
jgi:hypothetical protein